MLRNQRARVAKLADAPDLGSGGEIHRGSSPLPGIFVRTGINLDRALLHTGARKLFLHLSPFLLRFYQAETEVSILKLHPHDQ